MATEMEGHFAFVGLGAMGFGMASNIRQKMASSSVLFICDIHRPACDRFVSEFSQFGPIEIVPSAKEAAANAKVFISSLPSTAVIRKVYLDDADGVIAAPADPHRLILESSTTDVSSARGVAEQLAAAHAGCYVDTPVSGGAQASTAGKLSFMIGHLKPEESDAMGRRLERILTMMGEPRKLFWCGRLGAGLAAKISNNYISCTVFLVVAEALAIGVRSGIDPKLLQEVIHNSSGQTFMGDIVSNVPRTELQGRNGFPIHLMIKDVGLGIDVGNETGVTPRMALAALEIWKEAAEDPDFINHDGFRNDK
ncbi:MAG: hypothetical protein M1819_001634 [Sarea resinae]|nr:MAG: hypothetical protein M1819_001634 [Sarea resinae]